MFSVVFVIKGNPVLCICGQWEHQRCIDVKWVFFGDGRLCVFSKGSGYCCEYE